MSIATLLAIITAATPLVTAVAKKIFKTESMPKAGAAMVHQIIPLVFGLLSAILTCKLGLCAGENCPQNLSWLQCALYGLAAGAGGSYIRDFDSNITKVASLACRFFNSNKPSAPAMFSMLFMLMLAVSAWAAVIPVQKFFMLSLTAGKTVSCSAAGKSLFSYKVPTGQSFKGYVLFKGKSQ